MQSYSRRDLPVTFIFPAMGVARRWNELNICHVVSQVVTFFRDLFFMLFSYPAINHSKKDDLLQVLAPLKILQCPCLQGIDYCRLLADIQATPLFLVVIYRIALKRFLSLPWNCSFFSLSLNVFMVISGKIF